MKENDPFSFEVGRLAVNLAVGAAVILVLILIMQGCGDWWAGHGVNPY
jgi:hypothetical protein